MCKRNVYIYLCMRIFYAFCLNKPRFVVKNYIKDDFKFHIKSRLTD